MVLAPAWWPASSTELDMQFSVGALEYERLKDLLSRYISTAAALEMLQKLAPSNDLKTLEAEHALTAEAMAYLRQQRVPFNEILFLEQAIDKLSVTGATLEIVEVEAVQAFLSHSEGLRARWKDEAEAFPRLAQKTARFPDLRKLNKRLRQAVHNGEIDERYSPKLARI